MSKCYNCQTEFTLKSDEIKCDSCGKVINFLCHNCKQWFSIYDEEKDSPKIPCGVCGYYECPNCNVCGERCSKDDWRLVIKKILNTDYWRIDKKVNEIIKYIEEIKIANVKRECERGVGISYAKSKIKNCIVKMQGYRVKDEEDMNSFKERLNQIIQKPIGGIFTLNQVREKGNYGQEYRDVFSYCLCLGKLKKIKIKKTIDGEEVQYWVYKRVENGDCPYLNLDKLIIKVCPNKSCKIKEFPLTQTECCDPRCSYKKGDKKGKPRKLKIKISNKDICGLSRGRFLKDGESRIREY